jgi:putative ABC transport system permease protein
MDVQPVLIALKRQKMASTLIALEIALAFAILCNAMFIISQRIERSWIDSGVSESELVRIRSSSLAQEDANARSVEDAAALRALPGVRAVSAVQQVPFGESSWNADLATRRDQRTGYLNVAKYYDGGGMLATMGLRLIAGRDFAADEYVDADGASSKVAIVTQAVAEKLWPGQNPLGRALYENDNEMMVIGVVANLVRPSIQERSTAYDSVILPLRAEANSRGEFILRVADGHSAEVLDSARAALHTLQPNRLLLNMDTVRELQESYFRQDRVMAGLLIAASIALLVITALGIVGLTSFWVQQRRRQIGIRRALGATRARIFHYFQMENLLIVSGGIFLGGVAAYAINAWLMRHYELEHLPLIYFPIGAAVMWILGQLAVLAPAYRAMQVSQALAVRSQ